MSALQNQLYKKDIPGNLGVDQNVTNGTSGPGRVATLPLGTTIGPAEIRRVTAYEWSLVPTVTRTACSLTAVNA